MLLHYWISINCTQSKFLFRGNNSQFLVCARICAAFTWTLDNTCIPKIILDNEWLKLKMLQAICWRFMVWWVWCPGRLQKLTLTWWSLSPDMAASRAQCRHESLFSGSVALSVCGGSVSVLTSFTCEENTNYHQCLPLLIPVQTNIK